MGIQKIECKKCLDTGCYWDEILDNIVNCDHSIDEEILEEEFVPIDNFNVFDLDEEEDY